MKHFLLTALALMLAACSVAAPQATPTPTVAPTPTPNYSTLVITLERTVCFGFCPVYTLKVYGDGRVEYEGNQHVAVEGSQTATLTPEQVQELVAAYQAADYFNLKDDYTAPVTDLPSTITSVTIDGQTKVITNYGGCMEFENAEKAPQALCDFETKIDSLTNSAQWIGTSTP